MPQAEGIRILAHILQPREVLIGIEDNKPQAISMLRAVLADSHDIALRVIPTKYPSGGAKQLTQILTRTNRSPTGAVRPTSAC